MTSNTQEQGYKRWCINLARKKVEPITNLGDADKLTVQKSLPLFSLWRSPLTLAEFKILDTYLARINSHIPKDRSVRFEKGELEELLGVKRIRAEELDERLKNLGTPIKIDNSTSKRKSFSRISLFEKSYAEQDDDGLWQIELTASQTAMKYFFNIENLGYLRYKLRCITSLTSRYTYIMFIYLESNRYRKSWEVPIEELKEILNCEKEETYKEYKRFNDRLLKRVHKEMHEKTECKYSYEPVKKGRKVVAVRFEVESLPRHVEDIDPNQMTLDQYQESLEKDLKVYFEPLSEFKFSPEQLAELQSLLVTVPTHKLPQSTACHDNIDLMRYHYLDQKAKEIIRRDKQKRITNKFAYLTKMIKQDI